MHRTPFRRKQVIKRKSTSALHTKQPENQPTPPLPLPNPAMSSPGTQDGGLSCPVCLEGFTEDKRRPLMLPACGHTFCRMCLTMMMARDSVRGTFLCPSCRRAQPVKAVQDLPVNYALLEVALREVVPSSGTHSRKHSQQDLFNAESCRQHGSRLAFWCENCDVAACGECLFDQHPRPDHKLLRLHDQLKALQESTRVRAGRLMSQLMAATEENRAEVRAAMVLLAESLRQKRVLDDLTRRAVTVRKESKVAEDIGDVTSVRAAIEAIQREFQEAAITTSTRVCVSNSTSPSPSSSTLSSSSPSSTTPTRPSTAEVPRVASQGDLDLPQEMTHGNASPDDSLTLDKDDLPLPTSPPVSAENPASPPSEPAALTSPQKRDAPNTPSTPPACKPPPPWPHLLCGVLSGNWTSSRITLEPRGLHVYALRTMKDKCDLFVNMGVVSRLAPLKDPEVFMDLHDGPDALGRIYITLQGHLRRSQQFLSLCIGEMGPSYRNSLAHSVIRRGSLGEGLVMGDYEGKAGKGGAAIVKCVDSEEVAKRCERGMVVRASSRAETAAQFCIMMRDGPRNKQVFPFGRVTKGLSVVEEACKRPALSVGVTECGWVLPV